MVPLPLQQPQECHRGIRAHIPRQPARCVCNCQAHTKPEMARAVGLPVAQQRRNGRCHGGRGSAADPPVQIGCELDSPQATDVGINRNELQPQNSPNKFGPQTFFRSHAPDFHPGRRLVGRTTRRSYILRPHCTLLPNLCEPRIRQELLFRRLSRLFTANATASSTLTGCSPSRNGTPELCIGLARERC